MIFYPATWDVCRAAFALEPLLEYRHATQSLLVADDVVRASAAARGRIH
jgi:hypothetical protein